MMRQRLTGLVLILGLAVLGLAGCGGRDEATYNAHDITGVMPDLAFHLTDEQGRPVTADAYRGDFVVLYFGFTHCPKICPATMGRLQAALDGLPPGIADRYQVLFVSVDPERDPPARLAEWTDYFGPRFIGLTGTPDQLDALTKRYRVTYSYGEPNAAGFYNVNHSSALFVFDPAGRVRLLATSGEDIKALGADLATLAKRAGAAPATDR